MTQEPRYNSAVDIVIYISLVSFYVAMTQSTQVLALAKERGLLRARDVTACGIPRMVVHRLVQSGQLLQVGRGLFASTDADISEHHTLAEAGALAPNGVICLLSALRFHGLTTQAPFEVWMAIDVHAWRPRITSTPIRFVRFSGDALSKGVENHTIEGQSIQVYCPAKTVADCFKYRNKIGVDMAIEALKETLRARKATVAQISEYAAICRVANVMRPYLEALLS